MSILLLGLSIFFAMHLVPSFVEFRNKIITKLGENTYKGLYTLISITGIILIVYGMQKSVFQPLWEPPVWSKKVVVTLMILSFILLASANMKSNFKRFTRHPMLWGVTLWSGAHLLANGDLASLLLFGSFGVFALFDMLSANIRGTTKQKTKYPLTKDAVTITAGIATYAVFIFLHPYLFGVSVI